MNKKILPLGSIVKVNNVTIEVMITSYLIQDAKDKKQYHYSGVIWPKGMIDDQQFLFFNDSDIAEVLHTGFVNDEQINFYDKLDMFYEKNNI